MGKKIDFTEWPQKEQSNAERFREIVNAMADTYEAKNKDYGDSFTKSIDRYGFISALTRISDKFNRMENLILSNGERNVKDESLADTALDMSCYCAMLYMYLTNDTARDS